MTTLSEVNQNSTKEITFVFVDSAGNPVVPNNILWSLKDLGGAEVNGRTDEPVVPPASEVTIVLSGLDFALPVTGSAVCLIVTAEYDSSFGSDLPIISSCKIPIKKACS